MTMVARSANKRNPMKKSAAVAFGLEKLLQVTVAFGEKYSFLAAHELNLCNTGQSYIN